MRNASLLWLCLSKYFPSAANALLWFARNSVDSLSISRNFLLILRFNRIIESGSIVVATVNEMDATCKRLKKYSHGIALLSANPAYDPMYFSNAETITEPVKILGKVIELRAKFD